VMSTVYLVALVLIVSIVNAHERVSAPLGAPTEYGAEWLRVPGGSIIHRDCIHEVEDGATVDTHTFAPCKFIHPQEENIQIYSIDTHWTTTDVIMKMFNSSFTTPGNPPRAAGQINYFWPGFKSTEPTMGLPVIQPVLQYGTGNEWVVRSWYVYDNIGEATASPPIRIKPGDVTYSYMKFDDASQQWTIFANNTRTAQTTTLKVTKAKVHNTDFKVAMLVLETIMPPGDCKQLPASPSQITFMNNIVNDRTDVPWQPRTQMHDCNQKVASISKEKIVFSWTN